ncbi:hypothetical protein EYF80_034866 [Liparis tanakae]|uniref:Uncharacterized protein n=1 Tax=Liparis tanakae TaxID=230148 RepID=A0A4Z2GNR0_9TELE|nr:hypothetical protein EYF80_034866 [Liparis tanakae]
MSSLRSCSRRTAGGGRALLRNNVTRCLCEENFLSDPMTTKQVRNTCVTPEVCRDAALALDLLSEESVFTRTRVDLRGVLQTAGRIKTRG